MPTIEETTHAGGFILSEANGNRSRENGIINAGQDLAAGTVLGRLMTAIGAASVENTGDGVMTVGAIGANVQEGVYSLVCTAVSENAGTFRMTAPDGVVVGDITVGVASANSHVAVTIADGATDFAAGDTFTITVVAGDYEQLDPAEDDGAQIAVAILYAAVDATAADKACAVVVRDAVVNQHELIWPAGITADQKAAAITQLNSRGIFLR